MADPKPQNRNLSVVPAETEADAARGPAKPGQSVSDYMEELIDRLNKNMGLPRDSKPLKAADLVLSLAHHVEPASTQRDPDEEAVRLSRPSGERLYDLAAVRREAGAPHSGLAAALADRLKMTYWRLAVTIMALAASFGLVQWSLAVRSQVGIYSALAILIVGLFWLYRYFKGVSQLAKAAGKRETSGT